MMKATVIGCGRWGSFIAWYLSQINCDVTLYGRSTSQRFSTIMQTGSNGTVVFPKSVHFTSDLDEAINNSEYIFISIGTQQLRELLKAMRNLSLADKKIILCMKGLEKETGLTITQIVQDVTGLRDNIAVWVGPGHVQDFLDGIPNCMVIDSSSKQLIDTLIDKLSGRLIRFYKGTDIIGTEIGAATKNVIGIAAGMLDGLGYKSLKGALMARAPREIFKLIEVLGGNGMSAYGLCHLGDYEATLFSKYSHNRMFGEAFVKNEPYKELSEGVYTVLGVRTLALKYSVDMPICSLVYNVLYENSDIDRQFDMLFMRSVKSEF